MEESIDQNSRRTVKEWKKKMELQSAPALIMSMSRECHKRDRRWAIYLIWMWIRMNRVGKERKTGNRALKGAGGLYLEGLEMP